MVCYGLAADGTVPRRVIAAEASRLGAIPPLGDGRGGVQIVPSTVKKSPKKLLQLILQVTRNIHGFKHLSTITRS